MLACWRRVSVRRYAEIQRLSTFRKMTASSAILALLSRVADPSPRSQDGPMLSTSLIPAHSGIDRTATVLASFALTVEAVAHPVTNVDVVAVAVGVTGNDRTLYRAKHP